MCWSCSSFWFGFGVGFGFWGSIFSSSILIFTSMFVVFLLFLSVFSLPAWIISHRLSACLILLGLAKAPSPIFGIIIAFTLLLLLLHFFWAFCWVKNLPCLLTADLISFRSHLGSLKIQLYLYTHFPTWQKGPLLFSSARPRL